MSALVALALIVPLAQSPSGAAMHAGSAAAEIELVLAAGALLGLLVLLLIRELRRGRPRPVAPSDEARARAMMGELCPNGWQAQITLRSGEDDGEPRAVSVEWSEIGEEPGGSASPRRIWADTIADGLEAMVEDRRADEMLEWIERSASGEDDPWDGR